MVCPLCRARRAKRLCPALRQDICPVCCGTKRLVEIRCPTDCSWLASSRAHPPSTVLRQQERDARFLAPLVRDLTERASVILLVLQDAIARYRTTALPPLVDADVRDAARALAATFETSIIYEEQATSLTGQRLLVQLREVIERRIRPSSRPSGLERDIAAALRRIEQAAAEARTKLGPGDTAYLELVGRIPPVPDSDHPPADKRDAESAHDGGPLIVLP